jgi:hypothetical protein
MVILLRSIGSKSKEVFLFLRNLKLQTFYFITSNQNQYEWRMREFPRGEVRHLKPSCPGEKSTFEV